MMMKAVETIVYSKNSIKIKSCNYRIFVGALMVDLDFDAMLKTTPRSIVYQISTQKKLVFNQRAVELARLSLNSDELPQEM